MIWVFAARNDPFLWLTGWSFATYNRFHRWVARIATVQAVIHSIGYSVALYYTGSGAYAAEWSLPCELTSSFDSGITDASQIGIQAKL